MAIEYLAPYPFQFCPYMPARQQTMVNGSCTCLYVNVVALGVIVVSIFIFAVVIGDLIRRGRDAKAKDKYLIGPRYLDLDEIGQRGSYYALSGECMPESTRLYP
jgi:hypothetical protein